MFFAFKFFYCFVAVSKSKKAFLFFSFVVLQYKRFCLVCLYILFCYCLLVLCHPKLDIGHKRWCVFLPYSYNAKLKNRS